MTGQGSLWFGEGNFYNNVATRSLRMDYDTGPYLNFTPSSTGDRKTWTWSGWIKRTNVTRSNQYIYTAHSGSNYFAFYFKEGKLASYYGTGSNYGIISDVQFRDTTNWYHFVHQVDAANTSQKVWVNGDEIALNSSRNPGDSNYPMNQSSVPMVIGKHSWGTSYFNDMYLAEVNYTDGQKYEASDFGETKNGVWIAKEPNVTYGTNGYRLQFKQTGDGETTASSTTIGADTSGNNNHYKDYNLDEHDSDLPDSPENNFCTLLPLNTNDNRGQVTISRGALRFQSSSTNRGFTTGTIKLHGKVYFEVLSKDGNNGFVGINNIENTVHSGKGQSLDMYNGTPRIDNSILSNTGTFDDGDIMGVAVDVDAKSIQFFNNNSSVYSGNYTTDAEYFPYLYDSSGGRTSDNIANFGQDSSFTGEKTSGSNNASDDNGRGDFYYAPPSGFLALCSANMPNVAIGPNSSTQADDHFNTITYDGNGLNTHQRTDVGFQPDWLWIKPTNQVASHYLADSSRGLGTGDSMRVLMTNGTTEEYAGENDQVRSFDPTGFTLDDNTDDTWYVNRSSDTYVAWSWKANGGTTSNISVGDISSGVPSIASTVQANTTAGFSIITYTGTGNNGTIAHGLGAVPKMMIAKRRDSTSHWVTYHQDYTDASYWIPLNLTTAQDVEATHWNSTAPTSTVINLGDSTNTNALDGTYVLYAFAEIDGFSKFGSYNGNSNADGTFVYTGFRPAWLLIRRTAAHNWYLYDNKRNTSNVVDLELNPNTNQANATFTTLDFLSNGFKLRMSNDAFNVNTYIYWAFAEQPFKFSNAR